MSSNPIPPGAVDWLSLDDAVALAGKSKATFYRFVRAGNVKTIQVPRAGARPQTLFDRSDAERLATANEPAPQVTALATHHEPRAPRRLLLPAPVADAPPALAPPLASAAPRPVLRLLEAVAEFGLPASYVRELLQKKQVAAVRRGSWFISRASLEAFIANGFVKSSSAARRAPRRA
jgi:hypothetical protein